MNLALISQKLAQIATCCKELEIPAKVPLKEFASLPAHFRLAERDIQLIVDSAVDINNHLILQAGRTPPQKYFETFLEMRILRAVPAALARRLARTTGMRNRIVHEYETVDLAIVHRVLPVFLREYREYVRHVRKHTGI